MSRKRWPETVTIYRLSEMLGISTLALRDYRARGVLVPAAERGQFLFLPSFHGYLAHLRQAAERYGGKDESYTRERIQSLQINRQINEIVLAKLQATHVSLAELAELWKEVAGLVRKGVMSVPRKAKAAIPSLTPRDIEVLGMLARETLDMCAENADGVVGTDPAAFLPETVGATV